MSTIDYEDLETDTMYPPSHRLEPASYMRKWTIAKHPRALENFLAHKKLIKRKKKERDESNKHIS